MSFDKTKEIIKDAILANENRMADEAEVTGKTIVQMVMTSKDEFEGYMCMINDGAVVPDEFKDVLVTVIGLLNTVDN